MSQPRYIVWESARQFRCFGSLADALEWKGKVGGTIYEPLGMTTAEKVCREYEENLMSKKPMTGLYVDNPTTPEGKYLVKRRDGTVVEWPSFVLGARDPIAAVALRAYAQEVSRLLTEEPDKAAALGLSPPFCAALFRRADFFDSYRTEHGEGDPGMGPHRVDDQATILEMRKGQAS